MTDALVFLSGYLVIALSILVVFLAASHFLFGVTYAW
jgi:hypothetical protein